MTDSYDSIVLVSFGGPDGPDDVIPFLENVTRGRGVPAERLAEVAEQYAAAGGRSPINEQNLALIDALRAELAAAGIDLPVYYGNRNWNPFLADTAAEMATAGHRKAVGIVTSAFGSYSGCRQYDENIAAATADGPLVIDKARLYWNHPGFLQAATDRVADAVGRLETPETARLVFTAHSIPSAWESSSPYVDQLRAAAAEITRRVDPGLHWDLVYQSRSGPPQVPWLEPDINDHLRSLGDEGVEAALVMPLGFVSDHMEVVNDLDTQAAATAAEVGITMIRAATVGTHPAFVAALRGLVQEALDQSEPLAAIGEPWPNPCPQDCCPPPQRPSRPPSA